jgi:NADPH:quinone reductase-like Zn-dependent oxidoreductase
MASPMTYPEKRGDAVRASSLWCTPSGFEVREEVAGSPKGNEIVVRVQACSINPIDAKRAAGYGRRVLTLKRAGTLPRVLGNDFAGVVESVGTHVGTFAVGDVVFGLVPTGPRGAHSTHVCVDARWARRAPVDATAESLAVLPYCFTTAWRAVHDAGLTRETARGRRVLVVGAAGGLGRLATSLLASWGANVTAVARESEREACLASGARTVVDRDVDWSHDLARSSDAALNFAAWELESALSACLAPTAVGQATALHPLLDNVDRLGWLAGASESVADFLRARARARARAPGARYVWTLFAPTPAALDALERVANRLPVAARYGFSQAAAAFAHANQSLAAGRVVLVPE